jgi:hypothetical protein
MFKEVLKAHSLRWKTKHKLCFPPVPGVVNRDSFPGSNALFHTSEEDAPICLAFRHSHRVSFYLLVGYSSTFLHPFAPSRFRHFFAIMGALTPVRWALRTLIRGNEHPPHTEQVSLLHMTRPSMHSVTKHLTRPAIASPLPAQRGRLPGLLSGSGLRLESAGSSLRTAESCSSSYGLHVRLRLLPTPHHGDAVTIGYQERASPERGLSPLRSRLLAGARIPGQARMTN